MCGIFGAFRAAGEVDAALLTRGQDALRHRGPDDRGALSDGPFGIAMTRLAIIDVAGGRQPMTTPDGRFSLVFNGEVYNFRELRAELEADYRFDTRSDTEVVLAGLALRGSAFLARLNGIFALALLDRVERTLLLARDHLGVKPLYLWEGPGELVFASELKAITRARAPSLTLDPVAFHQVLAGAYVFSPRTLFREVRQVEPGHLVRLRRDGKKETERFWDLERREDPGAPRSLEDARALVRDGLRRAVRRQLVSDVPVGLLLSSGVDSSSILALMLSESSEPAIDSFTVVSSSAAMDEGRDVRRVAERLGGRLRPRFLELGAKEIERDFERIVETFDDLEVLPSGLAVWFAARAAREAGLKVVLSGNGGDELFYGYPTYRATAWHGALAPLRGLVRAAARALPARHDRISLRFKLGRLAEGLRLERDAAHFAWRSILLAGDRRAIARGALALEDEGELYPVWHVRRGRERGFLGLDAYVYADLKSWLCDSGLAMWDKAGMAHSVEIRVPFLDVEFVEGVLALDRAARERRIGTKATLREALGDLIPPEVRGLKKRGFHVPIAEWAAGPLAGFLRERTRELPDALLDRAVVERLWEEHLARREDHGFALFALACASSWFRAFAGGRA